MFCVDAANLHNIMNGDLRKFGEWMSFIMLSSKLLLKQCTSLSTTKYTHKIIYFSDYIHMNALCTTPNVHLPQDVLARPHTSPKYWCECFSVFVYSYSVTPGMLYLKFITMYLFETV